MDLFIYFPFLIHSVYPQLRHVVIIIFSSIRLSPLFKNLQNKTNFTDMEIMFDTGVTVSLAEGIIDDTCFVLS